MNILHIIVGTISLGLAILGAFLPILPTTPFLLLTAYSYSRGSKRFYHWFISTKLYKKHLDSFVKDRSMTMKTKMTILLSASVMLLFPLIFIDNIYIRGFIAILYIYKYYYFFTKIKTVPETENDQ